MDGKPCSFLVPLVVYYIKIFYLRYVLLQTSCIKLLFIVNPTRICSPEHPREDFRYMQMPSMLRIHKTVWLLGFLKRNQFHYWLMMNFRCGLEQVCRIKATVTAIIRDFEHYWKRCACKNCHYHTVSENKPWRCSSEYAYHLWYLGSLWW